MHSTDVGAWSGNWAWSLPLIIVNVLFHVSSLALCSETVERVLSGTAQRISTKLKFAVVMGSMTLFATTLHGVEAFVWAIAYRCLDALPDYRSAMLYSLSAMTSYGNTNTFLKFHWQLMGALESLNGMLLLGLTTAFLFSMIHKISQY
jgi:hypothetical protein